MAVDAEEAAAPAPPPAGAVVEAGKVVALTVVSSRRNHRLLVNFWADSEELLVLPGGRPEAPERPGLLRR